MTTLLRKEVREGWRTWRFVILLAVLAVSGLMSPLLAYYTPMLMRLVPSLPAGFSQLIPEPTVADAVGQYIKNVSQFGVLLIIVLTMGLIAAEKERGTAAMLFVHPVRRTAAVLAKWVVWSAVLLVGLLIAAVLAYAYTLVLFGAQPGGLLPLGSFLLLNALLLLSLLPFLALALLASAVAKTQAAAAGLAFGGLVVLLVLGSLPRIGDFMPSALMNWGAAAALGGNLTAWPALAVVVVFIVVALVLACLRTEREEL